MTVVTRRSADIAHAVLKRSVSGSALAAALLLAGAAQAQATSSNDPQTMQSAATPSVSMPVQSDPATPGQADPAAPPVVESTPGANDADTDIVVTGFRASLRSSIAVKRNLDVVAEIVSAEDIGRLPDVSIAESLARLPGVTSQRTGGQASAINIRGLSQDLVSATLNGREQVATSGNRVIEFDQYPSELVNQAAVYKSPKASQIEGGVAGKVELTTARPLTIPGSTLVSVNVRGVYNDRAGQNPDADRFGYRASASIQTKLLDDTLGLALGYARLRQANVATRFVGYDYTATGQNGSPAARDLDNNGRPDAIGYGFEAVQSGGNETRDGVLGSIQHEPTDTFRVLIDGYYSRFKSDVYRRGIRVENLQSSSSNLTNATVVGNTIVGGTTSGIRTRTIQQDENRLDRLYTVGGNVQKDIGRLTLTADGSYSRASSFFNNSGLDDNGNTTTTPTTLSYKLDGLNVGQFATSADYTNPAANNLEGFYIVPQRDTDRLYAFSGSALLKIDGPFLKSFDIGGRYGNRRAERTITSFNSFSFATPVTLTNANSTIAGFKGKFSSFPDFLVADIGSIFDSQLGTDRVVDQSQAFTRDQSFTIDEKTYAGYAQLNFDTIAGSLPFKGNIGLRVVHTDQLSSSTIADGNGGRYDNGRGTKFTDWLPQANFILSLTPQDQARLSLSRQISRPRFFDFRNSITTNLVGIGGGVARLDGSGGNPELKPFRANQFDATYEHYFGNSGSLVLGAFYKDIESFVIGGVVPNYDFAANGITTPPLAGTGFNSVVTTGNLFAPINGDGGYVYGFEAAVTKTFDFLPSPLDGLGAVLNISYNQSDVSITNAISGNSLSLSLPGLSKIVSNPTIFYEKSGFSTRVSMRYRSKFVAPQFGLSEQIVTNAAETVFDAQMSYEFPNDGPLGGLTLLAQANNFTDEPTRSYFGQTAQTGTLQFFGRQFYLGASLRF
ncbi:TonB-dependent receptor [Sphingomonas mollis]|uniref:TonB-dependent receptor n=1 Tax=Sphingomonas mollis TaxID=2795726 RepID=A0ABS0XP41_9SPHN|nr:TonB-dependent receptor [Sphingomonas sp. BT553]MBJ6121810.1 TonB-dependent receptor [Sphingomonas sp. BT553]